MCEGRKLSVVLNVVAVRVLACAQQGIAQRPSPPQIAVFDAEESIGVRAMEVFQNVLLFSTRLRLPESRS